MADIALNQETHDIDIQNGRLSILRDSDATSQRIAIRLKFFLGEWILDQRLGLPYYESILVKNPDLTLIGGYFREAILTTPGVQELVKFDLVLDNASRTLMVVFSYRKEGSDAVIDYDVSFIINAAAEKST